MRLRTRTRAVATDLELEPAQTVRAEQPSIRASIRAIDGVFDRMVACALEALEANRSHYDMKTKTMVHEPDHKARMEAVKWLAAYADGLPMQTTLAVNGDGGAAGAQSLEEAFQKSPALRSRLAKMLGAPQRLTKAT